MVYTHKNKGTCSRSTTVDIEGGVIKEISVQDGCDGNLKGICSLVKGMPVKSAIERLSGIKCGIKNTSCPDQISIALQEAMEQAQ